jgi:inner membrane protein
MEYGLLFGIGFIALGALLLWLDLHAPGMFLFVPSTVLIVLGALGILYPELLFSWWAPIAAVIVLVPVTYLTLKLYLRLSAPAPPETVVASSLVGRKGIVTVDVFPDTLRGKVLIENDTWSATAESTIVKGKNVLVVSSEGVHVVVKEI